MRRYLVTYWHRSETWDVTVKATSPHTAASRAIKGASLKLQEVMNLRIQRLSNEPAKETHR